MISFILNPLIFFSVLLGLFITAMYVAFNVLRESTGKKELEEHVLNLQHDLERLQKELSLKNELYQGLKGQYDELERDMEKLITQPQPTAEPRQVKIESSTPRPSIVDLLKSLNKTENT